MNEAFVGKLRVAIVLGALSLLCGCTESSLRLAPNFSVAVKQDVAAQVADPDAHYVGTPAPGSNGARVGLAQERYVKDQVITPASTETSTAVSTSGEGGSPPAGPTGGQ